MRAPQIQPVVYPESDGKPMAETDLHMELITWLKQTLRLHFPQAYVSGNLCLYYEEGNPRKMISPDVLVSLTQAPGLKRIYKAWEAHQQIDLAIEVSSKSTHREDHHKKKHIYEQILRVPYYVIFNPHVIYLYVFELVEGSYRQLETDTGRYDLKRLGLQISSQGNTLQLYDAQGVRLKNHEELAAEALQRASEAEALAEQEAQRASEAKALAEQEAQRASEAEALAEQEARRASEAKALAEQEAQRASEAKALAEQEAQRASEAQALAQQLAAENQRLLERLKQAGLEL